jgi:ABC-2 type transport system permease protein
MYVDGGSVPVRHPAHHRAPGRLTGTLQLRPFLATTQRILRQLAGDHRSVAMVLLLPSLVITLMYFMFGNAVHPPGTPSPFNVA